MASLFVFFFFLFLKNLEQEDTFHTFYNLFNTRKNGTHHLLFSMSFRSGRKKNGKSDLCFIV